jgi:hypothetical protein
VDAPADKKPNKDEVIIQAINQIATTKSGRIFFRWLANRCFRDRSTIVGNVETHEINPLGSVANAYVQRLYQDISRHIKPELRIKIDYPDVNDE